MLLTENRRRESLMQGENSDHNLAKNTSVRKASRLQKGQRIIYEGEEAEVISVQPLIVIKTKNRVVCGAIHKRLDDYKEG